MLRRYFITGLLVLVPFFITVWVLKTIVNLMDQTLVLLPPQWRPEFVLGMYIPGFGVILTLLIVLTTGLIAANFFGRRILIAWEGLLGRVPVVKSIYYSVKQVSDTLFSDSGEAFRKALLVQYPREGSWPTTPNPTSGFFLIMPKSDVVELEMSVDDALKYIISMGVVVPQSTAKNLAATAKKS
jgi:uncharacterized membrane protein